MYWDEFLGPKVKEMHQSLDPQPAINFNSFVISLSSLELFSNLKWVLFPCLSCYYWHWVRFPSPLWGRLYWAIWTYQSYLNFGVWTLTTLARSAIWFQNQNDQQNSLLQCWYYLIIFILLTSSTVMFIGFLSLYWCKSENRLVLSSTLWLLILSLAE